MLKHVTLILIILYFAIFCESMQKNVCKTLADYQTIQNKPNCWYNPDVGASAKEIVKRYGFPFQSYQTTTKDGYIVTLFRIPHNGSEIDRKRPVLFLQHGLAVDGVFWMGSGSRSSVFTFANNGYDVWISNSRGTQYSSKHIRYSVRDRKYWNFSFHELALFDVPAMVDFIVQETGQAGHITYVGHSMGTTISFIYASLMPKHAQKNLKSIVALAPVAYMDHVGLPIRAVLPYRYLIEDFLTSIGLYGIGPNTPLILDLFQRLCTTYPLITLCNTCYLLLSGNNKNDDISNEFPVVFRHYFSGVSLKTLLHYVQILSEERRFQFYDYGPVLNQKLYNSYVPPEYPLSEINIPVHLFYGKRDSLAIEQDVLYLYDKLKTQKTIMEVLSFAHHNFLFGVHATDFHKLLLQYF